MEKRHLLFWILVALIWVVWMRYMEVQYGRQKAAAKARLEKRLAAEAKEKQDAPLPAPEPPVALPAEKPEPVVDDLILGADEWGQDHPKFHLFAKLTNKGAAVSFLQLNRYDAEIDHDNPKLRRPLVLSDSNARDTAPSFRLAIVDEPGERLDEKTWQLDNAHRGPERIVFRTKALGGKVAIEKTYSLEPHTHAIALSLSFKNLTDQPIENFAYTLTGGNGMPIEGEWYTRYFRQMVAAHFGENPKFEISETVAVVAQEEKNQPIKYPSRVGDRPLRFAGIASQYFASLVIQTPENDEGQYVAYATPFTIGAHTRKELTNIGVRLTSNPNVLPVGDELVHNYLLFNGPKDKRLLAEYERFHLPEVVYYPDFLLLPIGWISRSMVRVLDFFEGLVGDYGIAIIMLTIVVRGAMAPLTFRQTKSMQRLQEQMAVMQPQIEEIKQKYKNDRQRLNHEIMQLYARYNLSPLAPLAGCLPVLLQMPIFVGLWNALFNAFTLRQSQFLYGWTWIKDLAAPDQLFFWSADIWVLGKAFNVLPILSIIQMLIQMRLSAPPATTPEQVFQRRMMTFMMVFMGFLFYKMPAGLCVYFLTSGLWSVAERQFLSKPKVFGAPAAAASSASSSAGAAAAAPSSGNGASWISPFRPKKKGKARR